MSPESSSGTTNPKPPGLVVSRPTNQIHLLGQTESIATNLQELAGGRQVFELALERRPLLARDAQELNDLASGGRVMDRLANALKEIVSATQRE
jgi:hypothetical protein